jgi:hypothetical protein
LTRRVRGFGVINLHSSAPSQEFVNPSLSAMIGALFTQCEQNPVESPTDDCADFCSTSSGQLQSDPATKRFRQQSLLPSYCQISDNPIGAASAAPCQVIFLIASNLARPVSYGRPAFPSATSRSTRCKGSSRGSCGGCCGSRAIFPSRLPSTSDYTFGQPANTCKRSRHIVHGRGQLWFNNLACSGYSKISISSRCF